MEGFALRFTAGIALITAIYLTQRRTLGAKAAAWAHARGLPPDAFDDPLVLDYVSQSRALRVLGVAVGVVLPPAVMVALGWTDTPPAFLTWPFIGYSVGAFYAGAVLLAPASPVRRRAALVTRSLRDYLHPRAVFLQRALPLLVAGVAAVAMVVPFADARHRSVAMVVGSLLGSIAAAVVAVVLERRVVGRPQPYSDSRAVLVDDAIRSHIVHTVAGAAIGVQVLAATQICGVLAMSDVQILRWTMWVPAVLGLGLAVGACWTVADGRWRPKRPDLVAP